MKRLLSLLSAVALIIISFPAIASGDSIPAFQRSSNISTWLWDTSEIVSKPDSIIDNLINNNVDVLFLQIDITIEPKYYKEFISKATANLISVYALEGSFDWVSDDGLQPQRTFISWLSKYQEAALPNEKFKGIHLDVEPYDNEQYSVNTDRILERYQSIIIKFKNQANKLSLEFGIDIPFWFYGVQYNTKYGNGNVAEWLCENVKSITIMAYRDVAAGTDGIIGISAKEMNLFKKYNVKGNIAVETGKLDDNNKFVTFYEEGQEYMYQQLDTVYQSYKSNPAFNGIGIHYLDSWMKMVK